MQDREPDSALTGRPRFATEVAAGRSVAEAAAAAGVSTRCGYDWLAEVDVRRTIREVRSKAMLSVASRLTVACELAISTLISVMEDDKAPAYARVNAASAVLTSAGSWIALDDLAEQMDELQEALAERTATPDVRATMRAVVGGAGESDTS